MSQKQNETFRQPKVEDLEGVIIASDNFDVKSQIYWGPGQNTELAYVKPNSLVPFTLLSIPLVARFNYYAGRLDTDDYCPVPPPPPPPADFQSKWNLCWDYVLYYPDPLNIACKMWRVAWIHFRKRIGAGGTEPPPLPTFQSTYAPNPTPIDDTGVPVEIYVFNCRSVGGGLSCRCHPDCNIGFDIHGGFSHPNPCSAFTSSGVYQCPGGGSGGC